MKTALFLAALACLWTAAAGQTTDQQERIAASFVLARGRAPNAAEAAAWSRQAGSASMTELLARHQKELQGDAAARRAVAAQAHADAFGRVAGPEDAGPGEAVTYTDLMQKHLQRLTSDPEAYRGVLERAYRTLIRREVYSEEIEYWKKYDTLSFVLLVGCIEDWARRNQPGLMVTAGTPTISVNSTFLTTVRLSPAVATEARAAAGLPAPANPKSGHHVVAPGAAQIASSGRIHFAAAGGEALLREIEP